MTIENWFSVPVLYHDFADVELKLIQKEIKDAMPQINNMDLSNPWGDTVETSFKYNKECNIIKELNLEYLNQAILNQADLLCETYDLSYKLTIKESWINISNPGGFQFAHKHLPYLLSGVYYYNATEDDGSLQFLSPNPYHDERTYPFGFNKITYKPVTGRLILFPSYLEHLVNINNNDSKRISLSFNLESFGSSR